MTGRLLAFVATVDLLDLLLRRPRPVDPFTAHVLPQSWLVCEAHGHQVVNVLERGCGCTPNSP